MDEPLAPPPALVLGCNTPHSIGVLSDWIEERTGHAPDFAGAGWSDDCDDGEADGFGFGNGNGFGDGNGYSDGYRYSDGQGTGDGSGDGYGYGDGEGDGYGYGYGGSHIGYSFGYSR